MEDSKRKYLVLDFDETLYNTPKFKEASRRIFCEHDLEFDSVYRHLCKRKLFSPEDISSLNLDDEIKNELLSKITQEINSGKKYLYPDSAEFIKKSRLPVAIFSFGNKTFQMAKIKATGIDKLVDKIKITQNSKHLDREMISQAKILVDDSLPTLEEIQKKDKKVSLYLIDRENRYQDSKIKAGIKKIAKLAEIKCR